MATRGPKFSPNDYRIEGDIVYVQLTQGKVARVNAADYPKIAGYRWCAARKDNTYYAVTSTNGCRGLKMHQVILPTEPGFMPDHIDHDGLNNVVSNLRAVTTRGNAQNRSNNTSGRPGVHRATRNQKWTAQIHVDGVRYFLGYFDNKGHAVEAYNLACSEVEAGIFRRSIRIKSSSHQGISRINRTGRWMARSKQLPDGTRQFLGCFATEEEAIAARDTLDKANKL